MTQPKDGKLIWLAFTEAECTAIINALDDAGEEDLAWRVADDVHCYLGGWETE